MDAAFDIAGILAAVFAGIHIFMGGPAVVTPLLAFVDIGHQPKYVNYYCWHLVSISLVLMSVLFLWPAWFGGSVDLAIIGSLVAAAFAVWGIVLPYVAREPLKYADLPQGWLFVPVALSGFVGVMG